jgi:hypothetical protein
VDPVYVLIWKITNSYVKNAELWNYNRRSRHKARRVQLHDATVTTQQSRHCQALLPRSIPVGARSLYRHVHTANSSRTVERRVLRMVRSQATENGRGILFSCASVSSQRGSHSSECCIEGCVEYSAFYRTECEAFLFECIASCRGANTSPVWRP